MKKAAVAFVLATASVLAMAQNTPAGLWKTIDDDGKTEKSTVRIAINGGVLTGKVEHITDPAKADEKCVKCEDDRKDKPIVGLDIIRGDKILDPENGREYRLRLTPIEGGGKLQVRGYLGPFYRTQVWVRAQ